MSYYASSTQHILAELERIDLLIRMQVNRAQQTHGQEDEFQGLYISEQEVQELVSHPAGLPRWAMATTPLSRQDVQESMRTMSAEIGRRKEESARHGIRLRLDELAAQFQLDPFDIDIVLACLAPELDLRYERLYGYLQDDVTKKRPSVDLVLNLLSPTFEDKLAARQRFSHRTPLLRYKLLTRFHDPASTHPPLLNVLLKVDDRIADYLLDADSLDPRLLPCAECVSPRLRWDDLVFPTPFKDRLLRLGKDAMTDDGPAVFFFQGPYGVGKQKAAEAICRENDLGLLRMDFERLLASGRDEFETLVRLATREAVLQGSALYWDGFDALMTDDKSAWLATLIRELDSQPCLTFVAGNSTWEPMDAWHHVPFLRVEFALPGYSESVELWCQSLNGDICPDATERARELASKFRLSGGQIRDAATTARNLARWRDPEQRHVTTADLHRACQLQSNRSLASLAEKITPHYQWDDVVLPADRVQQLRELCSYVKYRAVVYDEWGFDQKLSMGKGLNALFSGSSGTGKTMAAEIIAGQLRLELYKIDLATVVSKYIGETEKNLARIFAEAETSNAILFFDEADALFGKRSEVRDAHDRYANIEISYLLQRMEQYQGIVILATNLPKNMDDAFVRRMHFSVEFPFPNEKDRLRIWQKIWPEQTPRGQDLDLEFMARRIEVAGGNIRNIALAAAFLAADDGEVITMNHLILATRREYQKMGKVFAEGELTPS